MPTVVHNTVKIFIDMTTVVHNTINVFIDMTTVLHNTINIPTFTMTLTSLV